jgi:hypothetical protein
VLLPNDQVNIASYKFRVYLGPDEAQAQAALAGDEHTQQLDAKEVARLLKPNKADVLADSAPDLPSVGRGGVHANPLPDVYPEEDGR